MTRAQDNVARRRLLVALGCCLLPAAVAGCSSTVALTPGEYSNDPDCANVIVSLPESIGNEDRRWTDAQATGAWGNPAAIILTCGVKEPGPSELPCFFLGGTDWLALPQEDDIQRVVTFGRDPAVEVAIARTGNLDFASVLEELGEKISAALPAASSVCIERTDIPAS